MLTNMGCNKYTATNAGLTASKYEKRYYADYLKNYAPVKGNILIFG
jgi:hypothetical protein